MANLVHDNAGLKILLLSKKEAVEVIGLLSAQAAGVALPRHSNGAAPEVFVNAGQAGAHRLIVSIQAEEPVRRESPEQKKLQQAADLLDDIQFENAEAARALVVEVIAALKGETT